MLQKLKSKEMREGKVEEEEEEIQAQGPKEKSLLKVTIKSGFAQWITVGSRKVIKKMHG